MDAGAGHLHAAQCNCRAEGVWACSEKATEGGIMWPNIFEVENEKLLRIFQHGSDLMLRIEVPLGKANLKVKMWSWKYVMIGKDASKRCTHANLRNM